MAVSLNVIPKVLYRPGEAFESVKEATTLKDGILLAFVFAAAGLIISQTVSFFTTKSMGFGAYDAFFKNMELLSFLWIVIIIFQIIAAVVSVIAVGWLSAKLAKSLFKGVEDVQRTVGFLGYGQVISFVFVIINTVIFAGFLKDFFSSSFYFFPFSGNFWLAWGVLMLVELIGLVWMIYVNGTAVSVANNIKFLEGAVTYIISAIAVGIVLWIIMAIPMMLLMIAVMFGEGGMMDNMADAMNAAEIAAEEGDVSICYDISDPWGNMKEMCIMSVAEETNNVSLCYNITDWVMYRDFCIMAIAIDNKNSTLCGEIETPMYRKQCEMGATPGNRTNS
ncbi:MAG: hypothetical protein A7316_01230 [Candidatus Altiarchaeales archaeon WOR_SM1_86-2]|nr:MAG: hypothetical protein A7316_01230 [Candidatus Altiarchaeales archaeon WOR_SM1_86-2]